MRLVENVRTSRDELIGGKCVSASCVRLPIDSPLLRRPPPGGASEANMRTTGPCDAAQVMGGAAETTRREDKQPTAASYHASSVLARPTMWVDRRGGWRGQRICRCQGTLCRAAQWTVAADSQTGEIR